MQEAKAFYLMTFKGVNQAIVPSPFESVEETREKIETEMLAFFGEGNFEVMELRPMTEEELTDLGVIDGGGDETVTDEVDDAATATTTTLH